MLSTDSIRNKILEDARKSATQILSDADVRRRTEPKRIADARAKVMSDAQAQGDEMRDRMLRMAELDMRKELLGSKREVISEAFQKALERMRTMDVATAREFARKQLIASASGTETVVFSKADERIFTPEFIESVNEELKKLGRKGQLKVGSERRETGGGFILSDGGADIMCTYEALMSEARAGIEGDAPSFSPRNMTTAPGAAACGRR